MINLLAEPLFGRHIRDGTEYQASYRLLTQSCGRVTVTIASRRLKIACRFRKAEIEHFYQAAIGNDQVRALYVAMDDAHRMRFIQCVGNLHRYADRVENRERAPFEHSR